MTRPGLPFDLQTALDRKAHGVSRNDAAQRSAAMSRTYRDGGGSGAIRTERDALAYALARMPATFAAVAASLDALALVRPDFAPDSLLDVGAGPGTATWAAADAFASLQSFVLLDSNPALHALALQLAAECARFAHARYDLGDAATTLAETPAADLVVASYIIGELSAAARASLIALSWMKTRDTLLVVEPGTPAGYGRIIEARGQLIAQGAHVAAPCPHDRACPLVAPDWCHFAQRLPRSRAHKQLKGADLPFEDEKYSYVALSRAPVVQRPARVLAQPEVSKVAIRARLCTTAGIEIATAPRRDKTAYARFRKLAWGDAVSDGDHRLQNS